MSGVLHATSHRQHRFRAPGRLHRIIQQPPECSSSEDSICSLSSFFFYTVTNSIGVHPHSVNWTHTLRSLQITQKLCCNIDTANGLGPCTHQSSEDPHQLPPSYHILIPRIIIHGFLSVCFIFIGFTLGLIFTFLYFI